MDLALRRHLLDQMAIGISDIEAVIRAHRDLLRTEQRGAAGVRGVRNPARIQAGLTASRECVDGPVQSDATDAVVVRVRDEQSPLPVHGYSFREEQPGSRRAAAIARVA